MFDVRWTAALVTVVAGACAAPQQTAGRPGDEAKARAELLALHEATLDQHRRGDWEALVSAMRDPALDVGRGAVSEVPRAEAAARFRPYLERADFARYEDVSEPIVAVSADGSMGWVIARVRVEGGYRTDDGARAPLDATWSWIELYERTEGRWQRVGTVSSFDAARSPRGFAGALGSPPADVAEVLDAAQRAYGGRGVLDGLDAIYTEAAVTTPRGPATTRITASADGRIVFDQTTSGGQRVIIRALRDGQWRAIDGTAFEAVDTAARLFAEGHALHALLLAPTRLLRNPRRLDDAPFQGAPSRVLEFDDALENPVRLYYDPDTGLPRGIDLVEPGSEPVERIRVTVGDWRWLGPVRALFRASFEHRGQTFDYDFREIRFHGIPADAFAVPVPTRE